MTVIEFVTLEVSDVASAERICAAFEVSTRVRLRSSDEPTAGFRGFTLSLVTSQPANVDALMEAGVAAGASIVKPAEKSLWGYGGVLKSADGTIWTIASSSKKNSEPAQTQVDDFVLQLGVEDVAASKQFYVDHGFSVAKSFGKKYVEFTSGAVSFTLNPRRSLAKTAGVSAEGSGSHRLVVVSDGAPFTDPDGFVWERRSDA